MLRREAGVYIHFLQRGDTLSRVVQRHFHLHTGGSIARKVAEVARLSHIADPDKVRVGQAVVLAIEAPPGNDNQNLSLAPPATPDDLLGLQRQFESLTPTEQQIITRNWDTLDAIAAGASDGGTALSRFADAHGIGPANDIFGGSVGGAAELAKVCKADPFGGPTRLAAVLQPHAKRLMTTLGRARDAAVEALKQTPIRTKPSFTVRISPTLGAVRAANKQLALVASVLQAGKWLGRGSMAVNLVVSTSNVIAAPAGGKVKAIAKETGSIITGGAGAAIGAYVVCSVVLGLPTAGTSPLVCGLLVGSVGGYFGSKWGGRIGEGVVELAEGPAARLWSAYAKQFEGVPAYRDFGMLETSGM